MLFSIIVPVYNRPVEVGELLESLCSQTYDNFEVLIIEDGSDRDCRAIAESYQDRIDVTWHYQENSGQGFSRNYGFERASGEYLIVFDSDCLIPPHYLETVFRKIQTENIDAWGGPDRAHSSFSPIQKAINYAMTSPFTTGGIRGRGKHFGTFLPRSFNMGISREVFEKTGGYRITRMGEDLEFSIRIINSGFKAVLIEEAFVYHKRRTSFSQFFRQLHFFGRARVNLRRFHPGQVSILHLLPSVLVIMLCLLLVVLSVNATLFWPLILPLFVYALLILNHAYYIEKNFKISLLSVTASFIQLTAYGSGFIQELFNFRKNPAGK